MAIRKFVRNDNNLAIAYYRYSSSAQNEASIAQQREQAHAYAEAHGCAIEYVAETTPEDTPEGKLIESFFDSLAEFYSSQLSVNTTRGMRYNAENAKFNGHRVLGYRKSEDGRYEIDPVTAPVVQRIFAQYAEGKAMTDIIEDLTAQGVRSVNGKAVGQQPTPHTPQRPVSRHIPLRRRRHTRRNAPAHRPRDLLQGLLRRFGFKHLRTHALAYHV